MTSARSGFREAKRERTAATWSGRLLVVLASALTTACVPFADPLASGLTGEGSNIEGVVAPSTFDFASSKVMHASVRLHLPDGAVAGQVPVTLYDGQPADGGKELASGVTSADGTYSADVTVRMNVDKLVAVRGYTGSLASADTDGDGVADNLDSAPNDRSVAFESYAPAKHTFATIAFEDSWPNATDYDFNDLVVDYNVRMLLNSSNRATGMVVNFELRAAGAGQRNAFAFSLPIAASEIASVSGRRINSGMFPSLPTGVEARQRRAVIIVTDDVNQQLPRPSGYLVNTQNDAPEVAPEMITIAVKFRTPIAVSALGAAPFDPFLIVNRIRGREVHLADHAPTDLADVALFGTGTDDSRPAVGRYYRTRNNLPSALVLPTNWDYPKEHAPVSEGHLRFAEWAASGGTAFTDWYTPTLGYRAATQLYTRR